VLLLPPVVRPADVVCASATCPASACSSLWFVALSSPFYFNVAVEDVYQWGVPPAVVVSFRYEFVFCWRGFMSASDDRWVCSLCACVVRFDVNPGCLGADSDGILFVSHEGWFPMVVVTAMACRA
jgi:hypothetical protein